MKGRKEGGKEWRKKERDQKDDGGGEQERWEIKNRGEKKRWEGK